MKVKTEDVTSEKGPCRDRVATVTGGGAAMDSVGPSVGIHGRGALPTNHVIISSVVVDVLAGGKIVADILSVMNSTGSPN